MNASPTTWSAGAAIRGHRHQRASTIWQDTAKRGPGVLTRAAEIVRAYTREQGVPPTLRKLFYKLVSAELIPNDKSAYVNLARLTGQARLRDAFPDLTDETREISRAPAFDSPDEARRWLATFYRRERAATQPYNLYIACEKHGTGALLKDWYHPRGLAVVSLGGVATTQLVKAMRAEIVQAAAGRESIILYMGDYDASGLAIFTDFEADLRGDHRLKFSTLKFTWVGLTKAQVRQYALPKAPGKEKVAAKHRRAFERKYGSTPKSNSTRSTSRWCVGCSTPRWSPIGTSPPISGWSRARIASAGVCRPPPPEANEDDADDVQRL